MTEHNMPNRCTVCTVKWEGNKIVVNYAGFKRAFEETAKAAQFLDLPWVQFTDMVQETYGALILVRRDHLEQWKGSHRN